MEVRPEKQSEDATHRGICVNGWIFGFGPQRQSKWAVSRPLALWVFRVAGVSGAKRVTDPEVYAHLKTIHNPV